uniref:DNA-binding protein n=1 Tax=Heterorhabditis bacteriophora TaxID=37862 RepID=A0A1I7XRZ3_HETBA
MFRQQDPITNYNSSECLIPDQVTVFLSYGKGIVTGAHVRYLLYLAKFKMIPNISRFIYHWRKHGNGEKIITLMETISFFPNKFQPSKSR